MTIEQEKEDKVLKGIADISTKLLQTDDYNNSLAYILSVLGKVTVVDRVYLFRSADDPDNVYMFKYLEEWCDTGVSSELETPELKDFDMRKRLNSIYDSIMNKKAASFLVQDLPLAEQKMLNDHNVKSSLVIPIIVHDELWGFIGFDDTKYERIWGDKEISILMIASNAIGAAIERNINLVNLENARSLAVEANKAKSEFSC